MLMAIVSDVCLCATDSDGYTDYKTMAVGFFRLICQYPPLHQRM